MPIRQQIMVPRRPMTAILQKSPQKPHRNAGSKPFLKPTSERLRVDKKIPEPAGSGISGFNGGGARKVDWPSRPEAWRLFEA